MSFAKKLADKIKEKKDAIAAAQVEVLNKLKTTPEIQKERYDICLSCEKLYKPTSTCKICGCFMQVKTWLPGEACPLGKWKAVKIEGEKDG